MNELAKALESQDASSSSTLLILESSSEAYLLFLLRSREVHSSTVSPRKKLIPGTVIMTKRGLQGGEFGFETFQNLIGEIGLYELG